MNTDFYIFSGAYRRDMVEVTPKIKFDTLELIKDGQMFLSDNIFKINKGEKFYDIIQFHTSLGNFCISRKFRDLLISNNIAGWDSVPIVIEGFENKEYFIFLNKGVAGKILNLEALNNYETERTEFDITTWDGSEIFNLDRTLLHVCTQEVKDILESSMITNIEFRLL